MTDDHRHRRLLQSLDDVDCAREKLAHLLDDLGETLDATRQHLRSGVSMSNVHPAARLGPVRKEVSDALGALNSTLMHARAEGIRVMVDDEGLSLRDVARLVGHSRQFVSRLYHYARSEVDASAVPDA